MNLSLLYLSFVPLTALAIGFAVLYINRDQMKPKAQQTPAE